HTLADTKLTIVIGRSGEDAERPDTLWLDGDGDGAFAAEERHPVKMWSRNLRGGVIHGGTVPAVALRLGDATHRVDLRFASGDGKVSRLRISAPWCLEASLVQGETRFRVCFQDADADGKFGGLEDRWIVIPDRPISKPYRWYELRGRDEGMFLAGRRFEVKRLRGAEIRMELTETTEPAAGDLELARQRVARTWSRRFAKSRDAFVTRAQLDTKRPLAEGELPWLYRAFDRARARAKLTGKPLLVDLRAFWNDRAYAMDAYTYRDAEVDRLLRNRFILLQVIREQDPAGDHARLMKELGG
ncbi:MAG: hypothetical protein GY704_10535, partial [Phycisphaeraceae bacterium]|nr:hypothetical protein [Phycisphaeraceae bacterium]